MKLPLALDRNFRILTSSYFLNSKGAVMGAADKRTVRLSTKGQVVLPKSIRQRRNWESGASLTIEETAEGVLLKEASLFAPTKLEDVYGMLAYAGPPKSVEEMDASILAEAKRRNARD